MSVAEHPLTEILASLRLRSSLVSMARLRVPFGVACRPTSTAILHAVLEGRCDLVAEGAKRVTLRAGDLALLCRGVGHVLEDAPGRTARPIRQLSLVSSPGSLPTVGHGGGGALTRVLCGSFELQHAGAHQAVTRLLPEVLVVRGDEAPIVAWLDNNLAMLDGQLGREQPGGAELVRRLLDLAFVQVLRRWVDSDEGPREGWLGGLGDDRIAQALALVHRRPAGAWTTDGLAQRVGMSRSSFHRHFKQRVGMAPAAYLTQWRMECAAEALSTPSLSVAEVGAKVGYSSEDAFVRAFRRAWGESPSAWRRGRALAATG